MTLFPEIREQLLDAAFAPSDPAAADPGRRRAGRLVAIASVLVTVAVAAVSLVGLGGSSPRRSAPSRPPVSPPTARPPAAWFNALARAGQQTSRRDPGCSPPTQSRPTPLRFLTGPPPRSVTSVLASLSTPASGASRVTARDLRGRAPLANGIYLRYAWQGHADGIHFYVLPAAHVGGATGPARCAREEVAIFTAAAQRFPAAQRAAAIAYARKLLDPAEQAGVSLITIGHGIRGGDSYPAWRLAQLATNPALGTGSGGDDHSTDTTLLVPDQVASVTATYPTQTYPGRVPKMTSVTKRPVRNLIVFHFSGAWDPPRLTYRSQTGAIIAQTPHH